MGRCLHLSSFSRVCIRDGLWVRLCVLDVIWSGAVDRMKTRRPPVYLAVLSERVLYLGEESVCPAPPPAWASTIVCS